ncbi:hypothetical protein BC628DRAFT_1011127 [Trametes gibbosa]|nr:hypothetical protein BC628DRAFT_1011127 [Trametes gibbosa]
MNTKRHQPYGSRPTKPSSNIESFSPTEPCTRSTRARIRKVRGPPSKGRRPGDQSKRLQEIQHALSEISPVPSAATSTVSPTRNTPVWSPRETVRDVYLETIQQFYPYYTPKNDFEILLLSGGQYKAEASVEGIMQYVEKRMRSAMSAFRGSQEFIIQNAAKTLNMVPDITGLKPRPGDFGVFIRPIPNSEYSLRLFPGCKAASEYCLDFVLSATGEPVNSPFEFNLFAGPGPSIPVGFAPTMGIEPLECSFGIARKDIRPGAEKFVLRDGQRCMLQRPGHKDVQFTVPMRRRPEPPRVDIDNIELPEYV